jgi:hypothetical protein
MWVWNGGNPITGFALAEADPDILCATDPTRPPGYDHYVALISYAEYNVPWYGSYGPIPIDKTFEHDIRDLLPSNVQSRPVRSWNHNPNTFLFQSWTEMWTSPNLFLGERPLSWFASGIDGLRTIQHVPWNSRWSPYFSGFFTGKGFWIFSTGRGQADPYGDCRSHEFCPDDPSLCFTATGYYGMMMHPEAPGNQTNNALTSVKVECSYAASFLCVAYDD